MGIFHGDFKSLCRAFFGGESCRHTLESRLAVIYPVGNISQVAGGHTFAVKYFKRAFAVVSDTEAGIFKWSGIEIHSSVAVIGLGGEGAFIKAQQPVHILIGDFFAVVNMSEIFAVYHFEHIVGVVGAKFE